MWESILPWGKSEGRNKEEEGEKWEEKKKKKETWKKVCKRDGERKIDCEKNHNVGKTVREGGGGGSKSGFP